LFFMMVLSLVMAGGHAKQSDAVEANIEKNYDGGKMEKNHCCVFFKSASMEEKRRKNGPFLVDQTRVATRRAAKPKAWAVVAPLVVFFTSAEFPSNLSVLVMPTGAVLAVTPATDERVTFAA